MLLLEKLHDPKDAEVLLYLAEIYRNSGQAGRAIPLYERTMRLDPDQLTASVGLGAIRMERAEYADAIRLWEDALAKNAGLVMVRTNLLLKEIQRTRSTLPESLIYQIAS